MERLDVSRAFVKDNDEGPEPELPISPAPNLTTERGAGLILAKIEELRRDLEGLAESEAAQIRRELRYWEARRASMRIVRRGPDTQAAALGMEVVLRRPEGVQSLRIVGEDEADPASGLIAWTSPLALALEEAEAGETEVAGYADAMETVFQSAAHIPFTENHIKQLHGMLLRHSGKDERHRGEVQDIPQSCRGVQ